MKEARIKRFHTYVTFWKRKNYRMKKRSVLARSWVGERVTTQEQERIVRTLYFDFVDGCKIGAFVKI